MEQENLVTEVVSQDQQVAPETVSEVQADAVESAPAPVEQVQEKLIPQSQVNKIAAREAREAAERARVETAAEYERRYQMQAQQQQQQAQQQQPQSQMGGITQQSDEQVRRLIQEEAWRLSNQHKADHMLTLHKQDMDAARLKYDDFDDKYETLDVTHHPELILWTQGLPNRGEIFYDLASNPAKLSQILMLANAGYPKAAEAEFKKLSDSIKLNEDARKQPNVAAPLSQIKSNTVSMDNGEATTVNDFRKMFRG